MKLKRTISILLVAIMTLSYIPMAQLTKDNSLAITANAEEAAYSGTCGENLTWTLNPENGELVISGTGDMTNWTNTFSTPWYNYRSIIKTATIGSGVTSIGKFSFSECPSITSITVDSENTAYSSDEYGALFNKDKTELIQYPVGNKRTSYDIPGSITSINYGAFYRCIYLTNITIPDGITSIESTTFYGCASLESITIPATVTSIGVGAFSECVSLANVTIPESITTIESYAFFVCSSLTSVTIPAGVTSIGIGAFSECPSLTSITVDTANPSYSIDEYGALFNKDKTELIQYPAGSTKTEYEIPDSVTSIGYGAFFSCAALEYVHINSNVTSIGEYAFEQTTAYICSTAEDCYAKTYAENNRIDFKVCTGHDGEDLETDESVKGTDTATNITYSYENGCFDYDGNIDFEVITKSKNDYKEAFRGYANESDDIFFYEIKFYSVDDSQNRIGEIQPANGKKVKIGFPIPKEYEKANPKLFMVIHNRSDNNKPEFFIEGNGNIEVKNGYVYIWADNFSPFALVINYKGNIKTVSSIAIASAPAKVSYTYKIDTPDLSGLALTVTYPDGTTETVTDTSKMKVTGFDNTKAGTQTVTVEYEGATTSFDVTVSYAWWQWIIRILLLGFLWY